MRRRLTIAIVGVTAAALLAAGVGALLLARRAAVDDARQGLLGQATAIAQGTQAAEAARPTPGSPGRATILPILKRVVRLDGAEVVTISGGQFVTSLPSGLTAGNVHPDEVSQGLSTSGTKGNLVYTAVPVQLTAAERSRGLTQPHEAVVLTRRVSRAGPSWFYLVLVGAGTLAVAAVVAQRLSRRVTRPLDDAVAATGRIAEGDLATQVPVAGDDYPELASLTRSINTMAASLSRARGLERQFLMAVSHDLRTPLTSIRGFAEAIAEGAATDTQRAASVIASESRRLERLVGDLLELAKLDASRFSLDVRPTDVAEVVVDTTEGFRPVVEKAGLELVVACGDDGPLDAMADPDRLAQVLANLVENAYKFAGARIRVSAMVGDGAGVEVLVEDDGPGIRADELSAVFERSFHLSRPPARQLGSGLGLPIVAQLARAMGATVRAESPVADGGGTRMIVSLHR
ncbi:MAG TPA: HAMP domain-containing sensor histidine kinase [Acidimicrobiales bacterium]|nr:HAMP domain-containing sensor histidine kinase [Acidimicrobiales bacterium]